MILKGELQFKKWSKKSLKEKKKEKNSSLLQDLNKFLLD